MKYITATLNTARHAVQRFPLSIAAASLVTGAAIAAPAEVAVPEPAPIAAPEPEVITEVVEVVEQVEVPHVPEVCLTALDEGAKGFNTAADFAGVVTVYPPLVGAAAAAGMDYDIDAMEGIVDTMEAADRDISALADDLGKNRFANLSNECRTIAAGL